MASEFGSDLDVHAIRVSVDSGGQVHLRARWIVAGAVAVIVVAVGVVVAALARSRRGAGSGGARSGAAASSPAGGVASAYGYPERCLHVTVLASDPDYARADVARTPECGRYSGYVTAVFRRVGGAWQEVLDDSEFTCPLRRIPLAVQVALGVCAAGGPAMRVEPH